jgi:hypothetical protein
MGILTDLINGNFWKKHENFLIIDDPLHNETQSPEEIEASKKLVSDTIENRKKQEDDQIAYNERCFAENQKKQKIRDDLQTRILTEEEMQEVMIYGAALFAMYYRDEIIVIRQFNEAICQQYRLRAIDKIQRELIQHGIKKKMRAKK